MIKVIVEKALEGSPCKSFDYDNDVQPWIGSRAGLGGVLLGDDKPAPVLVLQVKDADKAESGFAELTKCAEVDDDEDFGWTISGDYILVSDSTSHAEAIASAGKESPLSSDADFQKWTDEAGGPAIVNAYFGRKGVKVLADEFGPATAAAMPDGRLRIGPRPGLDGGDESGGSGGVRRRAGSACSAFGEQGSALTPRRSSPRR